MRAHYSFSLRAHRHGRDDLPGKCNKTRNKTCNKTAPGKAAPLSRQRGVSLFTVLIILLLAMILVFGGLAVANLNETITGNLSDAQRAYGAAQALIAIAERDIRFNGDGCSASGLGDGSHGTNPGFSPALSTNACSLRFPRNGKSSPNDYAALKARVGVGNCGTGPMLGVCFPTSPNDSNFSADKVGNSGGAGESWNTGAPYWNAATSQLLLNTSDPGTNIGNYGDTALAGGNGTDAHTTSLALSTDLTSDGSRYWIEVFPYGGGSSGGDSTSGGGINNTAIQTRSNQSGLPCNYYPYIFRITARAYGVKSGTVSMLRTYYIPQANPTGKANC